MKAIPASRALGRQLGAARRGTRSRDAAASHPVDLRGRYDPVDVQIAFRRRGRPDHNHLIRELRPEAPLVSLRHRQHRLDPLVEAGFDHPNRDLAAVGDQYRAAAPCRDPQPSGSTTTMVCPYSTAPPFSTKMAVTTPSTGDDHMVHQLHHLDDGDRVSGSDLLPDLDERRRPGRRRSPEQAQPKATRSAVPSVGVASAAGGAAGGTSAVPEASRAAGGARRVPCGGRTGRPERAGGGAVGRSPAADLSRHAAGRRRRSRPSRASHSARRRQAVP